MRLIACSQQPRARSVLANCVDTCAGARYVRHHGAHDVLARVDAGARRGASACGGCNSCCCCARMLHRIQPGSLRLVALYCALQYDTAQATDMLHPRSPKMAMARAPRDAGGPRSVSPVRRRQFASNPLIIDANFAGVLTAFAPSLLASARLAGPCCIRTPLLHAGHASGVRAPLLSPGEQRDERAWWRLHSWSPVPSRALHGSRRRLCRSSSHALPAARRRRPPPPAQARMQLPPSTRWGASPCRARARGLHQPACPPVHASARDRAAAPRHGVAAGPPLWALPTVPLWRPCCPTRPNSRSLALGGTAAPPAASAPPLALPLVRPRRGHRPAAPPPALVPTARRRSTASVTSRRPAHAPRLPAPCSAVLVDRR